MWRHDNTASDPLNGGKIKQGDSSPLLTTRRLTEAFWRVFHAPTGWPTFGWNFLVLFHLRTFLKYINHTNRVFHWSANQDWLKAQLKSSVLKELIWYLKVSFWTAFCSSVVFIGQHLLHFRTCYLIFSMAKSLNCHIKFVIKFFSKGLKKC